MNHPSLPAIGAALAVLVAAASAPADIAPPDDYVETCTVDQQQRAGETCLSCSVTFEDFEACINTYEPDGYSKRCKTRGASVYSEVFCKPDATGTAGAAGTEAVAGAAGAAQTEAVAGAAGATQTEAIAGAAGATHTEAVAGAAGAAHTEAVAGAAGVSSSAGTAGWVDAPSTGGSPAKGEASPVAATAVPTPSSTPATNADPQPQAPSTDGGPPTSASGSSSSSESGCAVSPHRSSLGAAWLMLAGLAFAWRRRR